MVNKHLADDYKRDITLREHQFIEMQKRLKTTLEGHNILMIPLKKSRIEALTLYCDS